MTQTMLERAAVALMNRQRNRYGLSSIGVGMFDPEEIERAKDLVRAVLMAVREPSDALEEVGAPYTDNILPGRAFTAIIDFVLNEGEPK